MDDVARLYELDRRFREMCGLYAAEKKRADEAEARERRLREALERLAGRLGVDAECRR